MTTLKQHYWSTNSFLYIRWPEKGCRNLMPNSVIRSLTEFKLHLRKRVVKNSVDNFCSYKECSQHRFHRRMWLWCTPHLNYITKEHKVKKGLLTRLRIIYNSSPLSYTLDTIFLFHNEETNINDKFSDFFFSYLKTPWIIQKYSDNSQSFSSHLGIPSIMGDLHKRGSFFRIRVLTYQILIFVRLQWTYGTDKIAQWPIIHWRKYGWFLYFLRYTLFNY